MAERTSNTTTTNSIKTPAHKPAAAPGNGPSGAADPRLVVRFGAEQFVLGASSDEAAAISMGRDKTNTLVAVQKFVSRQHAIIERVRDRFVFTDMSANGTYILPKGKELLHVHGAKVFLEGEGMISLGLHPDKPEALRMTYDVQ